MCASTVSCFVDADSRCGLTRHLARPSSWVLSEDGAKTQKKVWEELNAKLEAIQPGITTNV